MPSLRSPPGDPKHDPSWQEDFQECSRKRAVIGEKEQAALEEIFRRAMLQQIEIHAFRILEDHDRFKSVYSKPFTNARERIPADFFATSLGLKFGPGKPSILYSEESGGVDKARWKALIVVERGLIMKDKGGRDTIYDYEGALIGLAAALHKNEVEVDLSAFKKYIRDWMSERYDNGGPDTRDSGKRAQKLFEELQKK